MKLKLLCSVGLLALTTACAQQGHVAGSGVSAQATQGYTALQSGDIYAAEAAYRAALAANNGDAYALLGLAKAREAQGDLAGAAQYYEAAQIAGQGEISTMRFVTAGAIDSDAQVGLSEVATRGLGRIYGDSRYAQAVYGTAATQNYAASNTVYQQPAPVMASSYMQPITTHQQGVVYSDSATYTTAPATSYETTTVQHSTVSYAEPVYAAPIYAAPAASATYGEIVYADPAPMLAPVPTPAPASYAETTVASAPMTYSESSYEMQSYDQASAVEPASYSETIAYAPVISGGSADYIASANYDTLTTTSVDASYTDVAPVYDSQMAVTEPQYLSSETVVAQYAPITESMPMSYDQGITYSGAAATDTANYGTAEVAYAVPVLEDAEISYGEPQPVLGGSGLLGPNSAYGIGFAPAPGMAGGQYQVIDSGASGAGAYTAQQPSSTVTHSAAPASSSSVIENADTSGLELIFLNN